MRDQIPEAAANESLMRMAGLCLTKPWWETAHQASGTTAAPRSLARTPVGQQRQQIEDVNGVATVEGQCSTTKNAEVKTSCVLDSRRDQRAMAPWNACT